MKSSVPKTLIILCLLLTSTGSFAFIRSVPVSYPLIQQAIDASSAGDTVLVEPGIYYENLNFSGKAILVESRFLLTGDEAHISSTIINGNNNGISAVTFDHSETNATRLCGFTITNANTQLTGSANEMGGGIKILNASPVIEHCIISGNKARTGGGIYMYGQNCNALISNCTVEANEASEGGGGIRMEDLQGNALVSACIIKGNTTTAPPWSAFGGGGIQILHAGKLENCLITGNSAPVATGGGIYCQEGSSGGSQAIFITGCTITRNSAQSFGGVDAAGTGGEFRNCILWDNENGNWNGNSFSYCCTAPLPTGTGNISNDPQFINAGMGNFRLNLGSPCINTGNDVFSSQPVDLDGNPRIIDSAIDMGCYESPAGLQNHFEIEAIQPAMNCTDVSTSALVSIHFNQPADTSTFELIRVFGQESGLHPCQILSSPVHSSLTLIPFTGFRHGETVEVVVPQPVSAVPGTMLPAPMVWDFRVEVTSNYYSQLNLSQTIPGSASGIIAAELNGDADVDFIRTRESVEYISVFKNNSGLFSLESTLSGNGLYDGTCPSSMLDLENDGDMDLVIPSKQQGLISLWTNNGNFTFSAAGTLSTDPEPQYLNVADFNGDGYQDFAVACNGASGQFVDIFLNNTSGSFNRIQSLDVTGNGSIDPGRNAADLDNDGDMDLALDLAGKLGILLNNGAGQFTLVPQFSIPSSCAMIQDINRDGTNDLISCNSIDGSYDIACYANDGHGIFSLLSVIAPGDGAAIAGRIQDVNADGDPDLVIRWSNAHTIRYYMNNGSGNFTPDFELPGVWNNAWELVTTDIDNDGDMDLIASDTANVLVYKSGLPVRQWTGNISSDWFATGNWNPATVPGIGDMADIETVSAGRYPEIDGQTVTIEKLIIGTGASLLIKPTGNLKVNYEIVNDGELRIGSDNQGQSGSLIDKGFTGTGTFIYSRNIKSLDNTIVDCADSLNNNHPQGWHYLSAPVSGLTTFTIPVGDYWINDWSEPENTWVNFAPGSGIPCIPASDNEWLPMKGYSLKYCPAYNCPLHGTGEAVDFSGLMNQVNTGPISIDYTATDNPVNDFSSWNLLGNPYPSAVDPSTLLFPISLDASVYYWDDVNLTYQAWAGGIGPNIPPAQGFFVHALRNGTLTFTNANRSFNGNSVFYKKTISHLLQLEAVGASHTDRTFIRFLDEASPKFDRLWDAHKIISLIEGVPQLYTKTGNRNLAINALPAVDVMPLCFEAGSSGEYSVRITENNDFEEVILEDLLTGGKTDLKAGAYTFSYVAGSDPLRFKLHFTAVGVQDPEEQHTQIYAINKSVRIEWLSGDKTNVRITDILGRLVACGEVVKGSNDFPVPAGNCIYFVTLDNPRKSFTQKVFIAE